jgi:predicted transcriptional regulator
MPHPGNLSRRERQIMEIVHGKGSVSVGEIRAAMPQPVSYSAVRVIVNVLEKKGHLRHTRLGKRYVYRATSSRARVVQGALKHLLSTYFEDSLHKAVAAMVQLHAKDLSDEDVRQLIDAIERSKRGNPS